MIAVCPNPFRDIGLALTREVMELLHCEGFECVACPVFGDRESGAIPEDLPTAKLSECIQDCTLAVVIGGDGTMLSVARTLIGVEIPILGVNLGTKGFMAALEKNDLALIAKAAHGETRISRRMMLDVTLTRDGVEIYRDCALNDAVIHGYGDCIRPTVWSDGDLVTEFSGDGIILSTPTGSTGYSMSAGGPIIEPDAENIIVSPICAHMMSARSFVIAPSRKLTVRTEKLFHRRAYLSVDGGAGVDIHNGDILTLTRSAHITQMANPAGRNFYEIVYTKLK